VIRTNLTLDKQDESTSHYVACSIQDNCQLPCWHRHKTVAEAAACIQSVGGFVRAVANGRMRFLTYEEQEGLVTALSALYFAEKELSRKDDTTGALNKRAFREVVGYEIKRTRRQLRPLTLAYIDLDGFKEVNDELGHDIGDLVLKVVVWTMQSTLREADAVARFGGDEFALLLPEASGQNARLVLDKLQKALKNAMKGYQWEVTFSVGAVTFRNPPATPDYMINTAEKAMRSVKRAGKNHISYLVLD
jgi:diguanylate cyclase (GGDEF)-like protein